MDTPQALILSRNGIKTCADFKNLLCAAIDDFLAERIDQATFVSIVDAGTVLCRCLLAEAASGKVVDETLGSDRGE